MARKVPVADVRSGDGTGEMNRSDNALTLPSADPPSREDLIAALKVAIYAWDARTTRDARKMIGLGGDISSPAMPGPINDMKAARDVLKRAPQLAAGAP